MPEGGARAVGVRTTLRTMKTDSGPPAGFLPQSSEEGAGHAGVPSQCESRRARRQDSHSARARLRAGGGRCGRAEPFWEVKTHTAEKVSKRSDCSEAR